MKISNIIILFYIMISVLMGMVILGFSLHLIELNEVVLQLTEAYNNINARIALSAAGVSLVLLAFLFAQSISERREREKTIAFNNPSGQVTITLFAVEDLIRRIGQELPQVKELKPDVIATKKRGLQVRIRLILKSATNIPEFTTQLQEMVKSKMQETLGIDEQIVVKIHIAKILPQPEKAKGERIKERVETEEQVLQVPFPRR